MRPTNRQYPGNPAPKIANKVARLPAGVRNPVDIHVGARVRMRRTLLGLNLTDLANDVGLTFQQVQKYESGAVRISASRLCEFSRILDVPILFFFDDMPDELKTHEGRTARGLNPPDAKKDPMMPRETMELVQAFFRIGDPVIRDRLAKLIKALAKEDDGRD